VKIGIDVSWAQGPPSGTATYITGLVEALTRVGPEHDYVLLGRSHAHAGRGAPGGHHPALPGLGAPNVRYVAVDAPLTNLRQQVTLPLALRRQRLDLYHSPAFFLPLGWRGPAVVSIFDVTFLRLRESWKPGRRVMYLSLALQAPLAARQARRIITLSRHSARDIARLLRVPLDKIAVVPAAPRDVFHRAPDPRAIADVQRRYGRYFLSVGVLAPQKNLERVLRAFAQVRDGATQLVLAGRPAGDYAAAVLRPLARTLGVERRIIFAGATDDEALRALYHAAVALVYPSLGEGFGLPLVEAMACGCPVLTSNVSSMPEVAGDAALLVDPRDVTAVSGALERLLDAPALRADLVARGRARAALFTWDEAARQTLRRYVEAVRA
jgi:glycosyltransferase involved in cell wall biosynthesis